MSALPMTEGELRDIATLVEIANEERHLEIFSNRLVGRVELIDPETGTLIGYLAPCDDWYGFEPNTFIGFGTKSASVVSGETP